MSTENHPENFSLDKLWNSVNARARRMEKKLHNNPLDTYQITKARRYRNKFSSVLLIAGFLSSVNLMKDIFFTPQSEVPHPSERV